jgi:ATP-dependent Lhr-like helicase
LKLVWQEFLKSGEAGWREFLRVYRRLESREIRGGRFVAGFSGEQFALPDAIGLLRETRRRKKIETWIAVSGSDPLNLAGILTPGPKVAALDENRLLYRDGVPMASLVAGDVTFFEEFDPQTQWQIRQAPGARDGACSIVSSGDRRRIRSGIGPYHD